MGPTWEELEGTLFNFSEEEKGFLATTFDTGLRYRPPPKAKKPRLSDVGATPTQNVKKEPKTISDKKSTKKGKKTKAGAS